ncbi:hypothetical protein C5167_022265 [Papaver somniferum]|uniref:Alpha-mannosidase n=1 Tax=Papaver somniferum TaxID=3469 RepID=A0A4Y7JIW1_PAPSO|nr:hypothetical protein C5167_022265 [Papaver somniferum]
MDIIVFFILLVLLTTTFDSFIESKYIVYNTSQGIVPGKINVHMVPHTHDDVGWLKTVDQYYVGSNNSIQGACVQNVLDSLIPALLADKNRKFIYVEMAFLERWWDDQSEEVRSTVKKLVSSGQLELINGGMCMHDEASPHYIDMIDQTTLGHRFIKKEFGVTPRIGWQIDPFGHSAVQAYMLGAQVGFDSLFFGRIDYQDREKRKKEKTLEVVWRGSKSLGSSAQIFAGAFPENYEPPSGFYFEVNAESPVVQDNMKLFDYNVQERVNDFVAAAVAQANITRTNHIMWTMGTDFKYQYAHSWYRSMDKLIHYVNLDGRVNAFYSTPSIYSDAKFATNESWPLKTDDYFPYADRANGYWTGYFTSRPALKRYVRVMSGYYLAARQLEVFKGRSESGPTTDSLADALVIAQHHDAVTGTEQQHVANDYAKRLSLGYVEAEELVASSLAYFAESKSETRCGKTLTKFDQCPLLNISYCPPSEVDFTKEKSLVIVVYNPLGWKREDVVRIPIISESVTVRDSNGKEVESQLIPLVNASAAIRNYYVKAYLGVTPSEAPKYWLVFSASVPPLGFSTYIVSGAKGAGISSAMSTTLTSKGGDMKVGQGNLKLIYDENEGKLTHYINSRTLVKSPLENSYSFYAGHLGTKEDPQASGAYVFRPNGTFPIKTEAKAPLTVFQGPVVDEVHQRINPWIYQITRVYKGKEHAEIRDYRTDWYLEVHQPAAGNYYPINLGLYIEDKSTELSVLVDRAEGDNWTSSHVPTFSGIDPSHSLPDNVALITLQELEDGKVLLRLAHLYEVGEDADLSVMALVKLKKLFPNKKIKKVTELSLSANQQREEMEKKRLVWKVEGASGKEPEVVLRGEPVDPTKLVVELGPMEIRTFTVDLDYIYLKDENVSVGSSHI